MDRLFETGPFSEQHRYGQSVKFPRRPLHLQSAKAAEGENLLLSHGSLISDSNIVYFNCHGQAVTKNTLR